LEGLQARGTFAEGKTNAVGAENLGFSSMSHNFLKNLLVFGILRNLRFLGHQKCFAFFSVPEIPLEFLSISNGFPFEQKV